MAEMGQELRGVGRCPHCSVASPHLVRTWHSENGVGTPRTDGGNSRAWCLYLCRSCGGAVTAEGYGTNASGATRQVFPKPREAHEDIPDTARRFLQQAYDTLNAPDASAVMAGSAVDAMLKAKGYSDGTLYHRIDKALANNVLTQGMADWAHSVRLGSNRPRHADAEKPHVSYDEARQSVDFAEALGNFLFVLTAKIDRGIKAAQALKD